ncbi:MAG TPA: FAD-dependent oxidoreductase [Flavisolibacter sp.]|nr:FAD-dependent oxidoreductase [Flavisolibacter sp.]
MQVDVLIIGQGLCGTMLSWALHKEGKTFFVIDNAAETTSSKAAAGVINPVTGRRYSITWMIEDLMDFARSSYEEISEYLGQPLLDQKSIIDFFPSPQMRNTFVERITENDTYLHPYPDQNSFNPLFNYDFGCGEVRPAYVVNVPALLLLWRKKLVHWNALKEEEFNKDNIKAEPDGISYQNITAKKIIFCDGIAAAENSPFSLLPFAGSKGEALVIKCEELPPSHIFKKGMMLAPLATPGHFWLGSSYQWEFEDAQPSEAFYKGATGLLNSWLKTPYKVIDHKAAIRPSTLERRPFVGFHPLQPAIGLLNGMGTKGASLAPFFAHHLVQHIVYGFPITAEADVHRFSRILSK